MDKITLHALRAFRRKVKKAFCAYFSSLVGLIVYQFATVYELTTLQVNCDSLFVWFQQIENYAI